MYDYAFVKTTCVLVIATIDRIYVFNNTELPKSSVSIVRSLAEGTKSFISSFDSGKKSYAADYKSWPMATY